MPTGPARDAAEGSAEGGLRQDEHPLRESAGPTTILFFWLPLLPSSPLVVAVHFLHLVCNALRAAVAAAAAAPPPPLHP
eukprot:1327876-Pyramimonas_sp.AAC.1